ncbi:MAG: hypothetical protein A2086_06715 [Spirochaetes bacterium GWD1_27_9]|nr:MAG: hypothetical protein A2Y34_10210 [Spirochaetes bacterium GWC1_27_15]OHD41331.1 MAG: hypothetical protein A2086_06715 [Spirochaetes bacterium GWD1_27_9]
MEEIQAINVAAAFFPINRKLLVVQRNEKGDEPLKWELPGGKLDPDEKFEDAMARELKEELGLDVAIIQEVGSVEVDKNDKILMMIFILVEGNASKIKLAVHKDLKLVSFDELVALDLCEADRLFVELYAKEIKTYID